jgi:hypothetical protein
MTVLAGTLLSKFHISLHKARHGRPAIARERSPGAAASKIAKR